MGVAVAMATAVGVAVAGMRVAAVERVGGRILRIIEARFAIVTVAVAAVRLGILGIVAAVAVAVAAVRFWILGVLGIVN
jgi:hypothetical protein